MKRIIITLVLVVPSLAYCVEPVYTGKLKGNASALLGISSIATGAYENVRVGTATVALSLTNGISYNIGTSTIMAYTLAASSISATNFYGNGAGLTGLTATQVSLGNVTNNAQIALADLDVTGTLGTSDTKVPSQKAVKTYVDAATADGAACPTGMAYIPGPYPYCVDKYEAYLVSGAVSNDACTNGTQAEVDANATTAVAGSAAGQTPLVSLNWCAAKKACQNAGKHLLTNSEWFNAANYKGSKWNITAEGAPMNCNTASAAATLTGANAGCVTQEGVYDMIGNVWEWVDFVMTADPTNGLATNYVTGYDFATGIPTSVGAAPVAAYGDDYYWAYNGAGAARAVLRGGAWVNVANAGVFAFDASPAPSFVITVIGFRCGRRK